MNQEQYQNLLSQIHELNRQNLLNENEKIEQVSYKIELLSQIINKIPKQSIDTNNKTNNKILIITLSTLIINTILLIFIITNNTLYEKNTEKPNSTKKVVEEIKPTKEVLVEEDNILSFNKESIELFEDENFSEIKPLIRKSTAYTCKDDNNAYKIPYTVEIKGKLYSDRFMFILQEDSVTKECTIKKENM